MEPLEAHEKVFTVKRLIASLLYNPALGGLISLQ